MNPRQEPRLRIDAVAYSYGAGVRRAGGTTHNALEEVCLHVERGETLGVVGESGSGKSTLGKIVLGLIQPHAGCVRLDGRPLDRATLHAERHRVQAIFQNPLAAFDPRLTLGAQIAEALVIRGMTQRETLDERVRDLARRLGLAPAVLSRRPLETSGGQCQRAAIARALIVQPDLIVCDEPVSALDLASQAQTLELLLEQQRARSLSYLFITHDLRVARAMAHRTAVLHRGRVVECAPTEELFRAPRHPYSRNLLSGSQSRA
jgi:ABC-type glutathione transport system ATPase component